MEMILSICEGVNSRLEVLEATSISLEYLLFLGTSSDISGLNPNFFITSSTMLAFLFFGTLKAIVFISERANTYNFQNLLQI